MWTLPNPPRHGEVAAAQRLTEGARLSVQRVWRAPSTMLRMVPLPVPGRN
jgi:hypothetical protein